jgi:enoyl-CoA hydratase/3-hydroxyacyl-CoA dehydrogenase
LRKETVNHPGLIKPFQGLPANVAIIGAGTIGPDIAYYLMSALPELKLVLVDIHEKALENALERISKYTQKGIERGKIPAQLAEKIRTNIVATVDYGAIGDCDWVLEAATENLELKKLIFSRVEAIVRKDALITSNTSSLPAARLFSHLAHPQRATVTHFFAPAFRNPVVEVIDWEVTNPAIVDYLRWFFYVTGKVPLLTADAVCFMLDRIFDNWCNEAGLLLKHATAAEIDTVACEFVHSGPFYVLNFANGNPIIVETNTLQMQEEGAHYRPAPIFSSVEKWRTVPLGKTVTVAPDLKRLVRDRLLGVLFSQTVDILDRNIGDAADLDLGCCLALAFKKGPIEMMKETGAAEVERILAEFRRHKNGMPMPGKPVREYFEYYRFLLVSEMDGCIIITLRRPEAMNALHDTMTDEILAVIRQYENDPDVAGFVITGYGLQAFCAGADIGRFPSMLGDKQQSVEYARSCSRLLVHLDKCQKPVVAALNGMALGGGLELAMRCHAIVAIDKAWMQLPEITLGIAPGIGAMVVPYRRWPDAAPIFHEMVLQARRLKAQEAHAMGMLTELVEDQGQLVPAAVDVIRKIKIPGKHIGDGPVTIASIPDYKNESMNGRLLSRAVMAIIRHAVTAAAASSTYTEALEIGYTAFGDSACTAAAREGITAFLERRPPDFAKTG